MPKPGDWRMTVEVLQSGQTRRYGDTIHTYRVFFEHCSEIRKGPVNTTPPNDTFEPVEWYQGLIERYLRGIYNWTNPEEGNWASPRLDYLRKVSPGLWEFSVREEYTG